MGVCRGMGGSWDVWCVCVYVWVVGGVWGVWECGGCGGGVRMYNESWTQESRRDRM